MGGHNSSKRANNKNKNLLKEYNPINILNNINSKYILKQIADSLTKKERLEFFKYNKLLKEKLDININDYKSFCEQIEIEIILKNEITHGKFINIPKEKEQYFHIYFNNDNKEIKRYYIKESDNVKKINIIIDNEINSLDGLFENRSIIDSINFKRFFRNNIINMKNLFFGCSTLKEINFNHFNTENVTDMSYMFYGCNALEDLNLSKFNTNNVKDMNYMFYGCSSLKKLVISNFNFNNVIYMKYMFKWCSEDLIRNLNKENISMNNKNFIGFKTN